MSPGPSFRHALTAAGHAAPTVPIPFDADALSRAPLSGDGASTALPKLVPGPVWFVADGVTCSDVWPYVPAEPRPLPFADGARVPAGFPSPADDFDEAELDIAAHLVRNPDATFFVRAQGDSMVMAGIRSGDVLVVDKSVDPRVGMVVIAVLDGQMTVKELGRVGARYALVARPVDLEEYPPVVVGPDQELRVWGVVVGVARSMLP